MTKKQPEGRTIKAIDVDDKIWRRFKGVAILRDLKIGLAVDEACEDWIRKNKHILENNNHG